MDLWGFMKDDGTTGKPIWGVTLAVRITLLSSDESGRSEPLWDGYRPVCVISDGEGNEMLIGLCELHLAGELPPSGHGFGLLRFHSDVADQVRAVASAGSRFWLADGMQIFATVEVTAIS